MKYMGLLAIALLATLLITPISAVIVAQEVPSEEARNMPEIETAGRWGKLKIGLLLNVSLEKALELAYAIRNMTYDLFQWEISYNITAANVTLTRGDKFLEKAISVAETEPRKAVVYAFVASIHYSHAPAFANPVLARVIRANLGENDTITEQTVNAVISAAGELRGLLVNAVEYAKSRDYDTTLAEKLLVIGDERVANATSMLAEGNVTAAFRHAVSGYRFYVRAYHALVRSVYVKVIGEVEGTLTGSAVEYSEPPARTILEVLPVQVRELVRARIQRGEIQKVSEIVKEIEEKVGEVRERIKLVEKENLKQALIRIMEMVRERAGKAVNITVKELEDIVEEYYSKGYRGTGLAKKVIEQLSERVSELKNVMKIPQPPARLSRK
ncbi:MAG: hypothetical protein QW700_07915 [Desulfurococcaceae archaeon]